MFVIKDLHVEIDGQKILKGFSLTIKPGEIHAIMGPNGSGKSTLCKAIMGHPKYTVTKGSIKLNNVEILELPTNQRANLGLFLGFQHPVEFSGITLGNFLRTAKNASIKFHDKEAETVSPIAFMKEIKATIKSLGMDPKFAGRSVNEGFSGGEKKRAEIAQMKLLEPQIALLDEIDSGLDIDALKLVSKGINEIHKKTNPGILLVTHYQRILNYIEPDFVHVMTNGKIIKSGDKSLAHQLEKEGYEQYI